jgi:hypothetical protein
MAAARRSFAVAAGAAGLASLELASLLIPQATSNVHHMSALTFYPLKALYDFSYNLLGLVFWTNTVGPFFQESCIPQHVTQVPGWIHFLGGIRQIGLCGFDIRIPFKTILIAVSAFGAMPALLGVAAAQFPTRWRALPFDVGVALIYGALAFAMAPLLGIAPSRYVTEAFPAFWMAGFVVLHRAIGDRIDRAAQFVALTIAAVWFPALLSGGNIDYDPLVTASFTIITVALVIVLALDVWAYRLIASWVPGPSLAPERNLSNPA